MKLLQLNIWEGKLLKEVSAFIAKEKPDILCLQEVYSCQGTIVLPDRMFNALEEIQEVTGYEHTFFSPVFTAVYAEVPTRFGLAIVSRFPITNPQATFISGAYNPSFTAETYVPNNRILQTCRIDFEGKSLSLANHHGYIEKDPMGSDISVEKMKLVKSKLEELPTPLILSGDLNVKSESPAMRVFDGFLKDQTAGHNISTTLSPLGKVRDVACDHILVSDDVRVTDFKVSDELVSDHKALLMEFEL